MIKKLKQRIFLIIMIPLSVITIGVIGLFSYLNYRNTINAAAFIMEGFENGIATVSYTHLTLPTILLV